MSAKRYELSQVRWERIAPLLGIQKHAETNPFPPPDSKAAADVGEEH